MPPPLRDELFLPSTKPFLVHDAIVLKPVAGKPSVNDAPERRIWGSQANQTASKKMRFPQKVVLSFAVVVVCGSSVLALPSHFAGLRSGAVMAPIPEPLPIPCSKQDWTNADRGCLSWTAPRERTGQATILAPRKIDGSVAAGRAKLPTIRGPYTIT
jgi:hypothetical protein